MKKINEMKKITIEPANFRKAVFEIRGLTPYVQLKFTEKAKQQMINKQKAGQIAKKGEKRKPKDFEKLYEESMHISDEGWYGIPCAAIRSAMISACRMAGFQMTRAKLAFWVVPDGIDRDDNLTTLTKITKGKPKPLYAPVTIGPGTTDIIPRAIWAPGWEAKVIIEFDSDQFSLVDISNLLYRAGIQVNIGCGRNDSKKSAGIGLGKFTIIGKDEK